MRIRFASLVVIVAFALAPLAQAVDCLMHVPATEIAHEHGHHAGGHTMPVADCFDAAISGMTVDGASFKLPVLSDLKPDDSAWLNVPYKPLQADYVYIWRGPPVDVFTMSPRRRI